MQVQCVNVVHVWQDLDQLAEFLQLLHLDLVFERLLMLLDRVQRNVLPLVDHIQLCPHATCGVVEARLSREVVLLPNGCRLDKIYLLLNR